MLTTDFDYYTAHQAEIVEKHLGEYVIIKDARVLRITVKTKKQLNAV